MALATLSIDLVAQLAGLQSGLDKAGRLAEQQSARISSAFAGVKTMAAGVGGALVAGLSVAGLAAGLRTTIESMHELGNAAQIAGAGVEEFQRWAVATETVGISQEKLGDQLKDFREKLGEFQQTGGGGMKDFFEQIAPKINLTADAFRGLSGPQALQLYYNSLEKAGLSQAQMSFYLESMASDTTALIPLLRQGGKGFEELGDRAERMGRIISADVVAASRALRADLHELSATSGSLAVQISGPAIKALADMSRYMLQVAQSEGVARAALISFGRVVAGALGVDEYGKLASKAQASQADLQRLTGMAERYQEAISRGQDVQGNTRGLERIRTRIADVSKEALQASQALKDFATSADGSRTPPPPVTDPNANAAGNGGQPTGGAAKQSEAQKYLEQLRRQVDSAKDLSAQEQLLQDIQLGRLGKVTPAQAKALQGLAKQVDDAKASAGLDTYIEQLQRAKDATADLTEEQKALRAIDQAGASISPAMRDRVISLAAEIDQTRDLVELKKLERDARAEIGRQVEADAQRLESLRGATDEGREAARLAELAFLHRQYTDGRIKNEQEYQALVDATNEKAKKGTEDTSSAARELGMTFSSAFEKAVLGGDKLSNIAGGLLKDIAGITMRKGVTEPMSNYVTGLFKGAGGQGKDGKGGTDVASTLGEQLTKGIQGLADSDVFKSLGDTLSKTLNSVFSGGGDWLSSLGSALSGLFGGGGGGGGGGLGSSIAGMFSGGGGGSSMGSSLGSWIGSLFSYDGGGSTGGGPRSGGLDGKGGRLALLHPQETVTDHYRGQRVQTSAQGPTVGQVHFNLPPNADADSFRRSQRQITLHLQRTLRKAG